MKARLLVWLAVALALTVPILVGDAFAQGTYPPGAQCGGFFGIQCAPGQYCEYRPGTCGRFDMMGLCQVRPRICPRIFRPVCGCDGRTYPNDCVRRSRGVSLLHVGRCR